MSACAFRAAYTHHFAADSGDRVCGRLGRLELGDPALLELDLVLPRPLEVLGGALELSQRIAERLAQFGQLARPEDDESQHEDEEELGKAKTAHENFDSRSSRRDGKKIVGNVTDA